MEVFSLLVHIFSRYLDCKSQPPVRIGFSMNNICKIHLLLYHRQNMIDLPIFLLYSQSNYTRHFFLNFFCDFTQVSTLPISPFNFFIHLFPLTYILLFVSPFPVFFQYCNVQGIYPAQIQNSVTQNNSQSVSEKGFLQDVRHNLWDILPG